MLKNKSGITLIALIITIIIMLILAGVSISLVLDKNSGIIKRTQVAVNAYDDGRIIEEGMLQTISNTFDDYLAKIGEANEGGSSATTLATTVAQLQEGDWVKYDTGVTSVGTNGVISCRVLYNDQTHGVQIISAGTVGTDITLGGNDWNTAKASYNGAIETLNDTAETYINSTYAYDARCVGSIPTVGVNGLFTAKDSENEGPVTLSFEYTGSEDVTGMKDTDTNYETDWNKMEKLGTAQENIRNINSSYFLASRLLTLYDPSEPASRSFCVRCSSLSYGLNMVEICSVCSDYVENNETGTMALRPCFSLKPDTLIDTGDGLSENTAYTLTI